MEKLTHASRGALEITRKRLNDEDVPISEAKALRARDDKLGSLLGWLRAAHSASSAKDLKENSPDKSHKFLDTPIDRIQGYGLEACQSVQFIEGPLDTRFLDAGQRPPRRKQ